MKNFPLLTLVGALFMAAVGLSSPLLTIYLETLGADYAHISLILGTFVAVMVVSNLAWGRLADRLGRRKPLLLLGLAGMAAAYFWLGRAPTANLAWGARVLEGIALAAYTTMSLTLMGDILESEVRKGRRMGLYRGLGSLAFSLGALAGGRIADRYALPLVFTVCAGVYLTALVVASTLREPRPAPRTRPTVGSAPIAPKPKRSLPILFLAGVLLWMAAHSASTSMWPNYMTTLGYSKTTISSLWGLAAFVEMPAMYLAGALSDVMGRAILLAAGGFAIALVQLGYMLLATVLPALFGVQLVRGFGFGSYTATAMTFTAEQGGQRSRGGNSGLFYMVGSMGQLLGMLFGGQVAQYFGFATLYATCAVLALSSALCFLALRRQTTRAALRHAAAD